MICPDAVSPTPTSLFFYEDPGNKEEDPDYPGPAEK
jgi:hypothetical protein